ncbi:uncharacterized protein PGTG_07919 [Puccinia graminis f. sp. tritici CRL 75-36-700-3]|uniref:Uncharacterized protein n=1 Tax=Puccinia graminis f. sp. tritici (strain CRL 75-36-700-3 / race SCCL) TaxID=418459 RepID=E3KBF8_PUCGT|nr:uncharacterized protein PGTG_07919 [Puccinia graminis f. sp. tritici CRL 75-36-700-3]EFP81670.2 hypothetical protein PGTG_07919 [Puccinia graminis f. sp. tritici CRL 75-36-700-3]
MNQLMRQRPVNNTDMPYMNYQPPNKPGHHRQTQTNNQNQTPLHSPEADHPSIEAVKHNKPDLQGPEDYNECPNDLDEHVNNLSEQEQAYKTISDNHDPEVLPEIVPESDDPQVTEPAFSMDNYSARDVNCWARTLSDDQFEQLRILGPASRIESFRQYAITNLDQPTQTFTQIMSSTPQSNQEPLSQIPSEVADNHNQYVDSTSNETNNPFLHSHHVNHQPYQSTHSSYYDCSNYNITDLDENPYDTVVHEDGVLDDGSFGDGGPDNCGFDTGKFDDGGFDDGGINDGGFDDGGFDNGGFDDGGFDDGGFDDGGFDEGGFDDGYGSPYY